MSTAPMSEQVRRLVTEPGKELGRLASFLRAQARLWSFCARRLSENNLTAMSAALSFRTIFALIPALVLALLAARALGALEDSHASLRRLLENSGFAQISVPLDSTEEAEDVRSGEPPPAPRTINVAEEIEKIVTQVESKLTLRRIGPIGAALFIWTALSLLTTIEQSLNRIFHAARSRSAARRVLLYWSVMTLGPVALAAAIYMGGRALQAFEGWPVLSWLFAGVGRVGPVLVGVLTLSAVYVLMPNTPVVRRTAFGAALVAVLLWLGAKWAFSLYIEHLVAPGKNLYGILGVLPLFLLWLNLSWTIFLFGAELAHTASNIGQIWRAGDMETPFVTPCDALAVTLTAAQAFQAGEGPLSAERIASRARLPGDEVHWLLQRLAKSKLVCMIDGKERPRYILSRPAAALKICDILEAAEPSIRPQRGSDGRDDPASRLAEVQSRMRAGVEAMTVADLLDAVPKPQGT